MQPFVEMMPTKLPVLENQVVEVILLRNELNIPVVETHNNSGPKKRRKNWNPEGAPLRRSERIRQRTLQKKKLESIEKQINVEKSKRETILKKPRRYKRKQNLPTSRIVNSQIAGLWENSQTNEEYYNSRIAEKVVGQQTKDGMNFILVKWKDIETPEYVENKNASSDILDLFAIYLKEEMIKLTSQSDEPRIFKKEPPSSTIGHRWKQLQTGEQIQACSPGMNNFLHVKVE